MPSEAAANSASACCTRTTVAGGSAGSSVASSTGLRVRGRLTGGGGFNCSQGRLRLGQFPLRHGDRVPGADRGLTGLQRLLPGLGEVLSGVADVPDGRRRVAQDVAVAVQGRDVVRARGAERLGGRGGRGLGLGERLLLGRHAGLRGRHGGLRGAPAAPGQRNEQTRGGGECHHRLPAAPPAGGWGGRGDVHRVAFPHLVVRGSAPCPTGTGHRAMPAGQGTPRLLRPGPWPSGRRTRPG